MDLDAPLDWQPPSGWQRVTVVDSHTGGEPFRVVISGVPQPEGGTVLERRRYAETHLDRLRRILMWEPRGHADMYGGLIGSPTMEGSDLSVLFMHNAGFSTMCGHGIIALTKVALDTGILPVSGPETTIGIDTPAGQVMATASVEGGAVGTVRFRNVPSFVVELDATVEVPGIGELRYDLAFGGAFYAYVDVSQVGLTCGPADASRLIETGRAIKKAVIASREIRHPLEADLSFLYGVIFFGPAEDTGHHSRNVCTFAEGELDRSPTGTGVSGRLAINHARGDLDVGETIVVESIVGSTFTGSVVEATEYGGHPAVIPEIGGRAHIIGRSEYWIDPKDSLGQGFLVR
ncbi:MAG TPA: proline racemase family protein [Acidimicrobiia bacterium]|nr:proline racemase family protein [Acidimicrobiia bacterium]